MSSYHLTDEHERELLHHLLGLDCRPAAGQQGHDAAPGGGSGCTSAVRVVAAIVLVLLGCGAALIAWGPLQNLFGYRDSPVSTYLLFGLPWLVLAVAAFAVAWRLIAR